MSANHDDEEAPRSCHCRCWNYICADDRGVPVQCSMVWSLMATVWPASSNESGSRNETSVHIKNTE
eukprot:scaffold22935_cov27-Prasinocladus_malaysianus.AAC.1